MQFLASATHLLAAHCGCCVPVTNKPPAQCHLSSQNSATASQASCTVPLSTCTHHGRTGPTQSLCQCLQATLPRPCCCSRLWTPHSWQLGQTRIGPQFRQRGMLAPASCWQQLTAGTQQEVLFCCCWWCCCCRRCARKGLAAPVRDCVLRLLYCAVCGEVCPTASQDNDSEILSLLLPWGSFESALQK